MRWAADQTRVSPLGELCIQESVIAQRLSEYARAARALPQSVSSLADARPQRKTARHWGGPG
jgi:hypothetical protein